MQLIPGTDFIFSGVQRHPQTRQPLGGTFDAEDFDDYQVLQRDMVVDGGLRPIREVPALAIRREAARRSRRSTPGWDFRDHRPGTRRPPLPIPATICLSVIRF
jgi:hypothetical protein